MDLMKKGIIFTMTSLMVSIFFVALFSADISLSVDAGVESMQFRVDVMDRFTDSWEDIARDALRTTSYRAFSNMAKDLQDTRTHYADMTTFEDNFEECLVNGTLEGGSRNCSDNPGKRNLTLSTLMDEMAGVAESNMSLRVNYTINDVQLRQALPFKVEADVNMSYEVKDVFASISRDVVITAKVPVTGLPDPLASKWLTRNVRSINETDISSSKWNKDNLTKFVNNRNYRYHPDGPSFLMRFTQDTRFENSTCCGIEAVLSSDPDIDDVSQFTTVDNASYVDHRYFEVWETGVKRECGEDTYAVNAPPDGVQMDTVHLASFNISTSDWISNCDST